MVPVSARRLEAEHFLDLVEQFRLGLLVDAHRAIALHVRMAAHRADPRAGLAEIAAQQQQIHDLLHVCSAEPMLGDPHAVEDDDGASPAYRSAATRSSWSRGKPQTRNMSSHVVLPQIVGERLEAVRMLRDEIEIEDRLRRRCEAPRHAPPAPAS